MAAPREVLQIDGLPEIRKALDPRRFREALAIVALDAFGPIVEDARRRVSVDRGKTKESIRVEVRDRGLGGDFEVVLGTGKPTGHLLEGGHAMIPRGPGRKGLDHSARSDEQLGRFLVRPRRRPSRLLSMSGPRAPTLDELAARNRGRGARFAALRRGLIERRAAGATGFVAARPFAEPAFRAGEARLVETIEKNLAIVLGWA